jgi:hypothetical protein
MVVQSVQDRVEYHFYFVNLVRVFFELALPHHEPKLC